MQLGAVANNAVRDGENPGQQSAECRLGRVAFGWAIGLLHFAPDILEIEEALLAG